MKCSLITLSVLFSCNILLAQFIRINKWNISSPDGSLYFILKQKKDGKDIVLGYEIFQKKNKQLTEIIGFSDLGVQIENKFDLCKNLNFVSCSNNSVTNDTLKSVYGDTILNISIANEVIYQFKTKDNHILQLVCRVFNKGVAFRYIIDSVGSKNNLISITKEFTSFKVNTNGKAWIQPYDSSTMYSPAYERYFQNEIPIGLNSSSKDGWCFPALFQSNKKWILITEADLTPDFCGTKLASKITNGNYKIAFPNNEEANSYGNNFPKGKLPIQTPWRIIVIGNKIADIYNNKISFSLNKPLYNIQKWIKPGKASWSWLTENNSPKYFEKLKKYVELSENMQWEYCLVDANWDLMEDGKITDLISYANSKNVGIWLWYNSGGEHNKVTERPRDIISDSLLRIKEFQKLQKWGVKGVKIDFWNSDKQDIIKLYYDVLKDAYQHQLMVNLHGCTIPRGWTRKFPHLVTMEAVKGAENYLFDASYPLNAPVQNTIIPFTRNIIGPVDYTPVLFSDVTYKHQTTNAHELALGIVFNTGLLHFSDNPTSYQSQPQEVVDFLKSIPVVFEKSFLVAGYPGQYIVVAKKSLGKWYVAGINSNIKTQSIKMNWNFLGNKTYSITFLNDGINRKISTYKNKRFDKKQFSEFKIQKNGGFVMILDENF